MDLKEPPNNSTPLEAIMPTVEGVPAAVTVSRAPDHAEINPSVKRKRELEDWLKLTGIIIAGIVVLIVLLTYVVGITEVNGISMRPTLKTGNVMVVWKWPQTWASITGGEYIPSRGNIVILKKTAVSGEVLIKRVIGLPGESVSIGGGKITIYNSADPGGIDPDNAPYGKNLVAISGTYYDQIPPGQIFVLGDNRNIGTSIDSRSSIGTIPSSDIVGQAIFRIYPFNQIKLF